MESPEIRQTIILIIAISIMMFARILANTLLYFIISTITMIVIILIMVLQQYLYQVELGKYPCLKILTYPERRYIQLFVKKAESIESENTEFIEVQLGKPIKHKEYGKLKKVYLEVQNSKLENKVEFAKGYVSYQGYIIDHPAVDVLIGYEVGVEVDHGQPYPVYLVLFGGKDFPNISQSREIYNVLAKYGK